MSGHVFAVIADQRGAFDSIDLRKSVDERGRGILESDLTGKLDIARCDGFCFNDRFVRGSLDQLHGSRLACLICQTQNQHVRTLMRFAARKNPENQSNDGGADEREREQTRADHDAGSNRPKKIYDHAQRKNDVRGDRHDDERRDQREADQRQAEACGIENAGAGLFVDQENK